MKAKDILQLLAAMPSSCLVVTNNGKKRTARVGYLNDGRMQIRVVSLMAVDAVLRNWQHLIEVRTTTPSTNPKAPMTIMTASWRKPA